MAHQEPIFAVTFVSWFKMQAYQYRSIYHFLWSVIRPYKWHYTAMLVVPILAAFYDFANNYAIKLVIDTFSSEAEISYRALFFPITLFISAQILLDLLWRGADVAEWRSEPYVRKSILLYVYDYVQHNPYRFFQSTQTGSITSRVKGILDGYDNFWATMHHDFTPKAANTIILTAVLAVVNVKACLLVAVWGLIFFTAMYHLSVHLGKLSYIHSNVRHSIFGMVADNIANIFTIFSFSAKKREFKRLKQVVEKEFIPTNIRVYKFNFLLNIIAGFLYWIMLIALFLFMIHLRMTQQATSGDLVFVMGITIKMSWDLWMLINKMQEFMENIGDFKSAFEMLTLPREHFEFYPTKDIRIIHPSIEFQDVVFQYEDKKSIFNGLNFKIQAGEKIGLVGLSGAGKSTLVSLLLKYFPVKSGSILIDNQDISEFSSDAIREYIAVIPQDILLFHRNLMDNIRYGNFDAKDSEVIDAAKLANIHDFILSLPEQYHSMVGERGVKLSGGQRQRIAIARAILKNAPILILDEATSSLDTVTEKLIQSSLDTIFNNANTTVIAIAHRLSTLKHMDRIIVLEKGKIVEEDTHNTLIQMESIYKRLWDMQKI